MSRNGYRVILVVFRTLAQIMISVGNRETEAHNSERNNKIDK